MITLYEKAYSFTRPADSTTYADNDLISNSTTSGSVAPLSWSIPSNAPSEIAVIRLSLDHPSRANATFRLHLLHTIPTFASTGDNTIVSSSVATGQAYLIAAYEGTLTTLTADGASGLLVPVDGIVRPFRKNPTANVTTTLYGFLEAKAAYAPKNGGTIEATLVMEK